MSGFQNVLKAPVSLTHSHRESPPYPNLHPNLTPTQPHPQPVELTLIFSVDQEMQGGFVVDEDTDGVAGREGVEVRQSAAHLVRRRGHAHFDAVVEEMRVAKDPRSPFQPHRRQRQSQPFRTKGEVNRS